MFTEKSFVLKPADADKRWFVIDGADQVVGRLASNIAQVLKGKNNPKYTPHTDSGDFVVVINAEKVVFTGNKLEAKKYRRHTNHIGGLKERTAKEQFSRKPEAILMSAVKGMLSKNTLGRQQLTKLKLFVGSEHTHEAQKPTELKF